jgi:hypothetical protein
MTFCPRCRPPAFGCVVFLTRPAELFCLHHALELLRGIHGESDVSVSALPEGNHHASEAAERRAVTERLVRTVRRAYAHAEVSRMPAVPSEGERCAPPVVSPRTWPELVAEAIEDCQ